MPDDQIISSEDALSEALEQALEDHIYPLFRSYDAHLRKHGEGLALAWGLAEHLLLFQIPRGPSAAVDRLEDLFDFDNGVLSLAPADHKEVKELLRDVTPTCVSLTRGRPAGLALAIAGFLENSPQALSELRPLLIKILRRAQPEPEPSPKPSLHLVPSTKNIQ